MRSHEARLASGLMAVGARAQPCNRDTVAIAGIESSRSRTFSRWGLHRENKLCSLSKNIIVRFFGQVKRDRKIRHFFVGGVLRVPDKRAETSKNASPEILQFRKEVGTKLSVLAKRIGNRHEAAKVAGVARSTLQLWLIGESDPSFIGIARLCQAADVPIEWLLDGITLPSSTDMPIQFTKTTMPTSIPPALSNENLMNELVVGITKAYADAKKDISLGEMGQLAARIAAGIWATTATVEERSPALKMALLQLSRDLSENGS